jgi:GNAT superfamily N-acetyltransferase
VNDADIDVRPMTDDDMPSVLSLLATTLGWLPDGHHERFFDWKHRDNPFGRSPGWVAEADGRVVALRAMLRWRFSLGGERVTAVRAVDTATHPDFQGRGLFRTLTMRAVDDLTAEGVGWVFNTPNDQSRPGYLKMGWSQVGRLPVVVRIPSLAGAAKVARARVPAELWSQDTTAGESAADVLDDTAALDALLASRASRGVRTDHTADSLRWRYTGFPELRYRAVLAGPNVEDGVALFRLRRRGPACEAAVCEVLAPEDDRRVRARLLAAVATAAGADHAVALAADGSGLRSRYFPLPGQGPILTWRPLRSREAPTDPRSWRLSLGDVELF